MRIAERGLRNGSPKWLLACFLQGVLGDARKRLPPMGDLYGLLDSHSAIRDPRSAFSFLPIVVLECFGADQAALG
jgi:hypothetical protein